ncbi:MAG: hypothetical protein JWM78_2691 [Verrucomicrobiaceae bacterium]|nr:hypothetical protein [Verrucomicrobiaceae bacterium]
MIRIAAIVFTLAISSAFGEIIASKNTQCLESLDWQGDYFISINHSYGIAYRWTGDKHSYFLVESDTSKQLCGFENGHVIVDALPVTEILSGEFYGVNFDCANNLEVRKGDALIGHFKGGGFVAVIEAWKVDLKNRKFIKVKGVQCNSFS